MNRFKNRRGATMILVGVSLVALVGVMALAIDMGRMYLFRAQVHVSSDAAALAGAERLLREQYAGAADTAVAYGQLNLVDGATPAISTADIEPGVWQGGNFTPTGSWSSASNAVRATSRYTATYRFGRIMGLTTRLRLARSVAAIGSASGTACARPLAVPYQRLLDARYGDGVKDALTYALTAEDIEWFSNNHVPILLKSGNSNANIVNGNFYGMRLPPQVYADGVMGNPWSGADDFGHALSATCDDLAVRIQNAGGRPYVSVGDWMRGENGNMVNKARDAIAALCRANGGIEPPGGTGNKSFTCNVPTRLIIAMWDVSGDAPGTNACGNKCFRVKAVGAFYVTEYVKDEGVRGYFSDVVAQGAFSPFPGLIKRIALVQ